MGHIIFSVLIALFVLVDARGRKMDWQGPLMTLLCWQYGFSLYMAFRHLKEGESRLGGHRWNIVKYFLLGLLPYFIFYSFWGDLMFRFPGGRFHSYFADSTALVIVWATFALILAIALLWGLTNRTKEVESGPNVDPTPEKGN